MQVREEPAGGAGAAGLAARLARLAAETFPLACPPATAAADIAAFVATHLSAARFREYLADPNRLVLTAADGDRIVGYAMFVRESAPGRPVELSKMYVLPDYHHTGAAEALMRAGLHWAGQTGAGLVWLGVNRHNARAQRFYRKHGFEVTGTRAFQLGGSLKNDFVMERPIAPLP